MQAAEKVSTFRKGFSGMIATSALYLSTGTFWGRKCSFENNFVFFVFFRQGAINFGPLPKSSTWLSKLFSTCRLAHFEGNYFSFEQKLIIILSCSEIEWICLGKNYKSFTFPDICRTYLHGVLQTDFYVNRATFWV